MFKALLLTMLLSNSTDVGTSLVAFRGGAIERNPLIFSTRPVPFIAQTAAFSAGEAFFAIQLHKRHPKLAKWAILGVIAGEAWAIQNNIRVIREQRR